MVAEQSAKLRREFLDPFFKALGWDVDNEQGCAEAYKDVIRDEFLDITRIQESACVDCVLCSSISDCTSAPSASLSPVFASSSGPSASPRSLLFQERVTVASPPVSSTFLS